MPDRDSECLFCRIVAGELPSTEVASTAGTYAFVDISPAAPTHVLVVPRRHIASAAALTRSDGDLLAELVVTAQRVAREAGIAESGYRLVFNVGDDAANSVAHLHLHVLGGRFLGGMAG